MRNRWRDNDCSATSQRRKQYTYHDNSAVTQHGIKAGYICLRGVKSGDIDERRQRARRENSAIMPRYGTSRRLSVTRRLERRQSR